MRGMARVAGHLPPLPIPQGPEAAYAMAAHARMMKNSAGIPERLSAYAQAYNPMFADMLAKGVNPNASLHPPHPHPPMLPLPHHPHASPKSLPSLPLPSRPTPSSVALPPTSQSTPKSPKSSSSSSSASSSKGSGHTYECEYCDLLFKDHLMHSIHMAQHKPGNPYECQKCGHSASDKVEFYLHQVRNHNGN